MITLEALKKLQALLAGAITTLELPMTVTYQEINSRNFTTEKSVDSITTGATAVDILSAPTNGVRRKVTAISIFNADSVAATVTVRLNNNGTTRVLTTVTLQTLETLMFDEQRGWYCLDVNGNQKTNAPASSGASSTADSKAISVSSNASSATSGVTSGSLNTSSALSAATSGSLNTSSATSGVGSGSLNTSTVLSRCVSRAGC